MTQLRLKLALKTWHFIENPSLEQTAELWCSLDLVKGGNIHALDLQEGRKASLLFYST